MDDILNCPICGNKLKNKNLPNKTLHFINKKSDYLERICSSGYNHVLMLFTDKNTNQIDLLRFAFTVNSSRFIEIDYINNKSQLYCNKNGQSQIININKAIIPDFPDLIKFKKTIEMYIIFS